MLCGFCFFEVMERAPCLESRFADAYATLRILHIFDLRKYLICRLV